MKITKSHLYFACWATFIVGMFIMMSLAFLFSEKEEFLKCDKTKDTCYYSMNTYINSTPKIAETFKISHITSIDKSVEEHRGRKGRVSYLSVIYLNLDSGTKIKYTLPLRGENKALTTYENFSNYLKNDGDMYYDDYEKAATTTEEILMIIILLSFLIGGLYGNYKKAFPS